MKHDAPMNEDLPRPPLSERALHLLDQLAETLRREIPRHPGRWLQAGAALGAVRAGTRTAGRVARRHPLLLAAAVVGAGVATWYLLRQRARRAEQAPLEGQARRVEAVRRDDGAAPRTAPASPPRRRTRGPASDRTAH